MVMVTVVVSNRIVSAVLEGSFCPAAGHIGQKNSPGSLRWVGEKGGPGGSNWSIPKLFAGDIGIVGAPRGGERVPVVR